MAAEITGIGSLLGGFRLEEELGRGGMGVVYKAHELALNRKVALKVLSPRLSSDPEFIQRFKREAQAIAALNHFNIVSILSYGEERGSYYFAMEYIRGKDLGRILEEKRIIPVEEALSITAQVAGALGEAGARGMVHRDLKPSNIMVDETGRVRVTDFGVAHLESSGTQLTRTGLFLGTPEFASPEQARGGTLDVRSDIYSLGAVLYRMLSGRPPFTGESPIAVVVKVATEPVTPIGEVNPSVPEPIRRLIDKMMAKDVQERCQTPEELVEAIDRCRSSLQVGASPPARKISPQAAKPAVPPRRWTSVAVLGGIVGVALAVFLVVWIVEGVWRSPVPQPLPQAEPVAVQSRGTTPAPAEPAPTFPPPPPAEGISAPPSAPPARSEIEPRAVEAQAKEVPPAKTPLRRESRTEKPKAAPPPAVPKPVIVASPAPQGNAESKDKQAETKLELAHIPRSIPAPKLALRSEPKKIAEGDVKNILVKYDFFEKRLNPQGSHSGDFVDNGDGTITDRATGLMWLKGGSSVTLEYGDAEAYLKRINRERFAGNSDWRLPTVEELASILRNDGGSGYYITPVFDTKQKRCWSSDFEKVDPIWSVVFLVDFAAGRIDGGQWNPRSYTSLDIKLRNSYSYVRAVRSIR